MSYCNIAEKFSDIFGKEGKYIGKTANWLRGVCGAGKTIGFITTAAMFIGIKFELAAIGLGILIGFCLLDEAVRRADIYWQERRRRGEIFERRSRVFRSIKMKNEDFRFRKESKVWWKLFRRIRLKGGGE